MMGVRMQWHQLDLMQAICTSLQTDNHTNTSSLNLYRPDTLLDAQPTVSKHRRPVISSSPSIIAIVVLCVAWMLGCARERVQSRGF